MRAWWIFAVLIACGDAGRADDCHALEAILHPADDMSMRHEHTSDSLATHDWQNPDVRAAVRTLLFSSPSRSLDSGWSLYTPYTVRKRTNMLGLFTISTRFGESHGDPVAALHRVCPGVTPN